MPANLTKSAAILSLSLSYNAEAVVLVTPDHTFFSLDIYIFSFYRVMKRSSSLPQCTFYLCKPNAETKQRWWLFLTGWMLGNNLLWARPPCITIKHHRHGVHQGHMVWPIKKVKRETVEGGLLPFFFKDYCFQPVCGLCLDVYDVVNWVRFVTNSHHTHGKKLLEVPSRALSFCVTSEIKLTLFFRNRSLH